MELPQAFLSRMRAQLGDADFARYCASMDAPVRRALRVNTIKIAAEALPALLRIPVRPCGVVPEGFFVPEGFRPGAHPLHAAGLYYMQEPSAQYPAFLLAPQPHETVLDLCAAPGGKTGQLAAYMQNTGLLIANEIDRARAAVLSGTVERLGVTNALVTNMPPDALCPLLGPCCDAVLVDAPCSGEGMFRREAAAVRDWSVEHVRACAERQRAILFCAAACVRPGGRLVYSTCTFSPEENEQTVQFFLHAHPDFSLVSSRRFYPQDGVGEGQFAALLVRSGDAAASLAPAVPDGYGRASGRVGDRQGRKRPAPVCGLITPDSERCAAFKSFAAEALRSVPNAPLRALPDGRVCLLPARVPAAMASMRLLRAGLLAGEVRKDRFVPDHALFLALPAAAFVSAVPLSGEALTRFCAGETVAVDPSLSGYAAVCAEGYPLGYGKAVQGTLKNHLPKGLRFVADMVS